MSSQQHYIWRLIDDISKEDSEVLQEEVDYIEDDEDTTGQEIFIKMKKKYPYLDTDAYVASAYTILYPEDKAARIALDKIVARDEEDDQGDDEDEDVHVVIGRLSINSGEVFNNPDLVSIYSGIKLDSYRLLVKKMYGAPVEFINDSISYTRSKYINEFIYSEGSNDKQKVLVQGIISCLYYDDNFTIECIISDTGNVSMRVKFRRTDLKNYKDSILDVNEAIRDLHKKISGNNSEDVGVASNISIKILFPTREGYIPKKTFSDIERVPIINEKVKFNLDRYSAYYSSNDNRMTFTVNDIQNIQDAEDIYSKIVNKVRLFYYNEIMKITSVKFIEDIYVDGIKNSKVSISTSTPHNIDIKKKVYVKFSGTDFDGTYVVKATLSSVVFTIEVESDISTSKVGRYMPTGVIRKQGIKTLRNAGLMVNSKECEKKRRPELLPRGDVSTGDDILLVGDRKFKCNAPYTYHGTVNKVNCCYKKKQDEIQEAIQGLIKIKKTPLKRYDKMKKFSLKTLEGTLKEYLNDRFSIMAVSDNLKDRTVYECIKVAYGNIIDEALASLSIDDYEKYYKHTQTMEQWNNSDTKSVDDIIKAVSLYKKVNILLLVQSGVELLVRCNSVDIFDKWYVIYKSNQTVDAYYPIVSIDNDTVLYEHNTPEISMFIEEVRGSCSVDIDNSSYKYGDIIKTQVTDINGIVVFIEVNTSGYIPVTPSTVNLDYPSINIGDHLFRLLNPYAQYKSLLGLVDKYPGLVPIGVTKVYETEIVTGIKLKNGGICPVSHSIWVDCPLDTVDDLFYIERYSNEEDIFKDEEESFKKNLSRFYEMQLDISMYLKNHEYYNVVGVVKTMSLSDDETSRLAWYLINNQ